MPSFLERLGSRPADGRFNATSAKKRHALSRLVLLEGDISHTTAVGGVTHFELGARRYFLPTPDEPLIDGAWLRILVEAPRGGVLRDGRLREVLALQRSASGKIIYAGIAPHLSLVVAASVVFVMALLVSPWLFIPASLLGLTHIFCSLARSRVLAQFRALLGEQATGHSSDETVSPGSVPR